MVDRGRDINSHQWQPPRNCRILRFCAVETRVVGEGSRNPKLIVHVPRIYYGPTVVT